MAMRAAIYARTCRQERRHHTVTIENQIAFCRDLASKHGLIVEDKHIFTDVEMGGDLPPTCWAGESELSRPALSALIEAIEDGQVSRVFVRRPEKLGTSSKLLADLLDVFERHDVRVITERESGGPANPTGQFVSNLLRRRIQYDTDADREQKLRTKAKKLEEIGRLHARLARLEAEVAELEG
jgi:DNA invertase Pin-like site-specific DNA recombinase